MVVGERRASVAAGLAGDGIRLVELPDAPAPRSPRDGEQVAQIAAALRSFESVLGELGVDRLVIAGASNEALAAVLVATKTRVPVASLNGPAPAPGADSRAGLNAILIARLADATLADDGEEITSWLRNPQEAAGTPTGH
jgi:hypothetical protein